MEVVDAPKDILKGVPPAPPSASALAMLVRSQEDRRSATVNGSMLPKKRKDTIERTLSSSMGGISRGITQSHSSETQFPESIYRTADISQGSIGSPSGSSSGIDSGVQAAALISEETLMEAPPKVQATQRYPRSGQWSQHFRFMVQNTSANSDEKGIRQEDVPLPSTLVGKNQRNPYLEHAPEHSIEDWPRRVLVARNILRKPTVDKDGKPLPMKDKKGQPLAPDAYDFFIFSKASYFLSCLKQRSVEGIHNSFIIVEGQGPVFDYNDHDLPSYARISEVHGDSCLDLIGYASAVNQSLISAVLGVNVDCFGAGVMAYDSTVSKKWSGHTHRGNAYKNVAALKDTKFKCRDRLAAAYAAGLPAASVLYFMRKVMRKDSTGVKQPTGALEPWPFIDFAVYTKKRLFRLPECEKVCARVPLVSVQDRVPLWSAQTDSAGRAPSIEAYDGISAGMIMCRNSPSLWNKHNVTKPQLLAFPTGDVETSAGDFRCLPITGEAAKFSELLNKKLFVEARKNGETPASSSYIEECFETMFNLLYSEGWAEKVRLLQDKERSIVEDCFHDTCARSKWHLLAMLTLWPHAYLPGAAIDQKLPGFDGITFVESITEVVAALGETPRHGASERFKLLWDWRTSIDVLGCVTCTEVQRTRRTDVLKKLGADCLARFVGPTIGASTYNSTTAVGDVVFLDAFISEVLLWSGQNSYVYEMESSENRPICPVPLQDRALLDRIYDFSYRQACQRLERIPEVKLSTISETLRIPASTRQRTLNTALRQLKLEGKKVAPFLSASRPWLVAPDKQ
jgi:hypothetical protein